MHDAIITLIFTIAGLTIFSFVYWRDAIKEGYSPDKIFDSIILILSLGYLGGKVLFRPLSLDYFRYQFFTSPLILEGVLIGGLIAALIIVRKYNWDPWKIGDMIAPALTLFQLVLFLGFWYRTRLIEMLINAGLFFLLYMILMFLKRRMFIGSSYDYAYLKRLNKPIFSGGLLAAYLTGSSLIAILSLVKNSNTSSGFWWFQLIFYLVIIISTLILIIRRIKKEEIKVSGYLTPDFKNSILSKLSNRKKELEKDQEELKEKDPFFQEYESEGTRNLDGIDEEASDTFEHTNLEAERKEMTNEVKSINEAIRRIDDGSYGICKKCGEEIDKDRIEAYPTAEYCIKCAKELNEKRRL